jgi:peptidoglycan-associated lipoprotein
MRHDRLLNYGFVLSLTLFMLWGCPKKTEVTSAPEAQRETAAGRVQGEEDARKAAEAAEAEAARRAEEDKAREKAARAANRLQPVYFDFDKSSLRDDAREAMKANAEWLRGHPGVRIRIEGNCDELGTKEYNQTLGQRRAANARRFLMDMGIAGNRVTLLSYGKEKPVCAEGTDECRQKNRRDDFVATGE